MILTFIFLKLDDAFTIFQVFHDAGNPEYKNGYFATEGQSGTKV